ncbi:UDP-glucose 4-epimerase [Austwickia chelonae]|uniref:Putative NAD-dependent epimerase/dehydratase n=1 Tax=Austwickia chelonae NBRC 105200 TaxID=1184607 RepID=K6UL37_9MICO|nr:NAD-dependent epimerase/dehydratase family protein [Austwickia chelonae]GAB76906.1 putative NAD-dependent epimerase/dehydratase [Austwickia chelonae NBRC 105200]SEW32197.1 UDP-glucose 4-epimerase [Austwickia chelonae]
MARAVLVTGVSRHLGARVARGLALRHDVSKVIGLDMIPPREELGRAEFVRADVRNPIVARLLEQARIDTVVHLSLSTNTTRGGARASQKEANVLGAMQLFAACQQAAGLSRIVLKSTCAVYGASPRDPALFTEDQTSSRVRSTGGVRDALEVEGYLRAARRRRPDLEGTVLRLAHVVGPHMSSPLLDYLALPVVPVPLGYNARLQFLHEDDAVAAIITAVVGPAAGVVNVAGEGIITLLQAVALSGRAFVPVPTRSGLPLNRLGHSDWFVPFDATDVNYLRYGRVMDVSRAREHLGFIPRHSTREAFLEAVQSFPPPVPPVRAAREWAAAMSAAVVAATGRRTAGDGRTGTDGAAARQEEDQG